VSTIDNDWVYHTPPKSGNRTLVQIQDNQQRSDKFENLQQQIQSEAAFGADMDMESKLSPFLQQYVGRG